MNENPKPRKGTFLGIPYDWRSASRRAQESSLLESGEPAHPHAQGFWLGFYH